jgi:large subunit ribosomal protein L29
MKYADISGLADKEIQKKITQLQTNAFEAKMKNALGQLANPMEIRTNRRDLARLKTAMAAKSAKTPLSKASREDRQLAALKAHSKKTVGKVSKPKAAKGS